MSTSVRVPIEDLVELRRDQENYYELLSFIENKIKSVSDTELYQSIRDEKIDLSHMMLMKVV